MVVTVLVVRFGHWVCGESWHAIKGPPPQFSRLGTWCVCICIFGGLSSFYIWVDGLCVVVWGGEGGGGVVLGSFLVFLFVFYSS